MSVPSCSFARLSVSGAERSAGKSKRKSKKKIIQKNTEDEHTYEVQEGAESVISKRPSTADFVSIDEEPLNGRSPASKCALTNGEGDGEIVASTCPVKGGNEGMNKVHGDVRNPASKCPMNDDQGDAQRAASRCPLKSGNECRNEEEGQAQSLAAKCPLGYDSGSFKIGPLSCVICRALLYDSSRCIPCNHIFCRVCISRFQDCIICGADIQRVDSDIELQKTVDRFIEGHARIKRASIRPEGDATEEESLRSKLVSYEDVSLARGSFLIHHAMRAFQGQNFESAKSRLELCAQDTREELFRSGSTTDVCSQLGAVLGMLGDCNRALGDAESAVANYEESVELLSGLHHKDDEVIHALSVSLNKLGDLKYYGEDLAAAHAYYKQALELRQKSTDMTKLSSQVIDVAVSLAKVADVSRAMGNESTAFEGFQEAVKILESLFPAQGENNSPLEKKRLSVLEFLHQQLAVPNS